MKGWLRWFGLVGGAIVALVLIAAGLLAFLVSRIDVRAEVERAVENATGRDLTIAGAVGVSYWPVLGVHASEASLANVEGGRAPAFLTAKDIHVGVELRPLLEQRVVVRRLVFQEPQIALEVDAQGRPNWVLAPAPPAQAPAPGPSPAPPTQAPPPAPQEQNVTLRDITISDGAISFSDARRGTGWIVGDVNVRTAIESLTQPMRVEGSVVYADEPIALAIEIGSPGAAMRGENMALNLDVQSALLTATFTGRTTAASGEIGGTVRASGPSLRRLAAWGGAPLQGAVGFEQFAVAGRLDIGGGAYSFSNAGFALDLIRGRGDFVLSQRAGKPYVSGRLELFDFDLNPYLTGQAPPQAPQAEIAAAVEAPAPAGGSAPTAELAAVEAAPRALDVQAAPSETPIDFSGLKALNADLELITHAVLVQRMRIDAARLNLVLNDGFMAATLHQLSLYGGSGSGRFEIDARQPAIAMRQELLFSGIEAQRFLSDAINFAAIEGRTEMTLNLRTTGRTQSEMIAALDGSAHLETVSGVLHGVDLGGVSRTIRNAMRGELIAPEARTPFQGFSAHFAISDGVLASESLSFNTPDLRIPGIGLIDLPGRRLDMRLAPRSPRGGVVFPFAVRGPWGQFAYAHDISDRAQRDILARVRQVQAASRQRE